MKRTTPVQCFRKPAPEAASGNTLQTDDKGVNIIETNRPFERINWINDSVIKSVTCRHLMAVLFLFFKYHFSYLNHWIFLYSKLYI